MWISARFYSFYGLLEPMPTWFRAQCLSLCRRGNQPAQARIFLWVGVFLLASLLGEAQARATAVSHELRGRVVAVIDGDTLSLQTPRQRHTIRLASIDAPEIGRDGRPSQAFSQASRRALDSRVLGELLQARCFEIDNYGRDVCELLDHRQQSINRWLVSEGWAWANREQGGKYLRDPALPGLEAAARASRRGLWAHPEPSPPWVFRQECWRHKRCP